MSLKTPSTPKQHKILSFIRDALVGQPVAHERVHSMVASTEAPQLDLFSILNFSSVTIAPFDRNLRIGIRIDKDIESAVASIKLG